MGPNRWPGRTLPQADCLKVDQRAERQGRFVGTAEESGARRSLWMKAAKKKWAPARSPDRFLVADVQVGKKFLGLWTDEQT